MTKWLALFLMAVLTATVADSGQTLTKADRDKAMQQFIASRAHTIEYIKTTKDDLRDHFFDHPVPAIGTLDAYQWIMLISGHSRRHTLQILEVKADPNFPKS